MNWIKFVENHKSEIRIPRIGRSIYSNSKNDEYSNTLIRWYRNTQKTINTN